MNNVLIWIIILVAVVGGIYLFAGSSGDSSVDGDTGFVNGGAGANVAGDDLAGDTLGDVPVDDSGELVTFVLTGENFKFTENGVDAPELKVNQGDTVRVEFSSVGGFHDWVVDEFDAATGRVSDGESTFVEFVANEKGTFEYYCSVGQHRANGMKGVFVVE